MTILDARATRVLRADRAQRWVSILVGAAVFFLVGWMTVEAINPRPIKKDADGGLLTSGQASATPSPAVTTTTTAHDAGTATEDLDGGLFLSSSLSSLGDASAALATGGPRQVKLGVVLVTFQGAEGAPATARNKRDALSIAERLGQEAKTDFHHAVTGGDSGSSDDIGRIPRGVLDPRTETSVFALTAGEVSDVLETPRGYWIVRRIE